MSSFRSFFGCIVTVCFALVLLVGCKAATYETTYYMSPPSTEEGRVCVAQCQSSKDLCNGQLSSTSQCQYEYRACHQLCGGIVVEDRVCIDKCSKVA